MKKIDDKRIKNMTAIGNLGEVGLFFLLNQPYFGIKSDKKLRYEDSGKLTYVDIFKEPDNKKRPLFIYIHGGGWLSGTRFARQFYCKHWVKRGFVAASVGYDYGVGVSHPTHIKQIFKAIEYLIDNADKYGVDKNKIVLAGESAGGYFSSMIGAVTTHKELYDKLGIDFKYRDTFKPAACVLISGLYDYVDALSTNFKDIDVYVYAFCRKTREELEAIKGTDEYKCISSASYFDKDFPPSMIIGSDKDPLVTQSEKAAEALRKAGVKYDFFVCSGINGVHAGALSCDKGKYGKLCAAKTEKFLKKVL